MLSTTAALYGQGMGDKLALITDGAFLWRDARILHRHVGPEAALGGPIAFVKNGDMISIDAENGKIDLEVSEAELARAQESWKPPRDDVRIGCALEICATGRAGASRRRHASGLCRGRNTSTQTSDAMRR
ncbi:MAG: dihydroxy-acid dehydratase [Alphaproteobacteria bacterium]